MRHQPHKTYDDLPKYCVCVYVAMISCMIDTALEPWLIEVICVTVVVHVCLCLL